jgi:abhydrolase domain-containing protein 17
MNGIHWNTNACPRLLTTVFVCYYLGPPSEEHCYADIEAAYDYLRKELQVPAQNIVLYGRSLGSGPSTHLAAKTALTAKEGAEYGSEDGPVGGLILHAPFLSVFRVVVDTGCTLYGDKFPNVDIIPMVKSPTILIHGTSDQIVPFNHSERLYQSIPIECRARPLYIEGMSHNNVHSQVRPMFVDRLCEYLDQHVWPTAIVRQRSSPHTSSPSSKIRKRVWKIVDANPDDASEQLDVTV